MASMECSGVWRILVVSSMFLCASIILTAPGVKALRFLKNPPRFSTAYVGMSVDFNCTTDDPNATVSLLHSSNFVTWIEKLVTPNKLVLRGQVFTLLNLVLLDGGQYACKATNQSGQTIQSSATFVHIIPGGLPNHFELTPDGPIYVLQGKDGTVTCECDGANVASLKWEFKGTSEDAYAAVPSGWVTNIPEPSTNKRKAILKLTKARLAYSGIYKCTVTVNDKSDSKLVNIQVRAPTAPTIKPYKGETVITEESTKVIQCVGEGYPKPKVTWYRNGKMLNTTNCVNNDPKSCENVIYEVYEEGDDPIYTNQTLKIRSAVYPRDIGEFKCVASNGISPDAELSINLDVQVAPKILEQKNLPVAQYDEEFSVSCKLVKGNPLPTFKWQYALHNLDCAFIKSNCFPDVSQWKPVPQQLMITPTATPTNESIVKVESHQQNTFYRCQAFNKLGNDSQLLKFFRLGKNIEAIEIDKAKTRTEHNVQSTLHVYCIERSGGFLKVLFTKDGKNLLGGNDSRVNVTVEKKNKQESLYTLTVKNLTLNDTGSYGCTSEPKYREILSSINITIKSLAGPNISDIPDRKVRQVEQGGIVMLWCQVTGNPKPSITWYFYKDDKGDGEQVNKENNDLGGNSDNCMTRMKGYYYLSRDDPSRLVICNPEFEQHQGKYQCHVENKVGIMDKDAYVIVEMVPVIIEPEMGYTTSLKIEETLNMTCKAKGNPSPNITWIKNNTGAIIASSATNSKQLIITPMKEEDFGVYSCIASNMLKSTEVAVDVKKASPDLTSSAPPSGQNLEYLYYIIAALAAIFVAIVVISIIWYIRKRRIAARKNVSSNLDEEQGIEMDVFNQDVDKWEIKPSRIKLQEVLGIGSFGAVWKANFNAPDGRARRMPIAAKCFTPTAGEDGRKALMREIELGKLLGESAAPNIVKFIGCVTTQIQPILVMEYMAYGDLLGYLRKSRGIDDKYHVGEDVNVQLQAYDLVLFAQQIAAGMVFLGSRGIIHRDLAARNVLLDKNYVCKVTDFGLAYQNFKYGHGNAKKGCMPIKWTAPEILYGDPADLSTKSDVWSYGVVLYEIFTIGGIPYPEWSEGRVITEIKSGYRMPKPEHIDNSLYHHMCRCWEENPDFRPHFEYLRQEMTSYIETKMYLSVLDMARYNAAKYSKVEDLGAEERPQEKATQSAKAAEASKKPIPPPRVKFASVRQVNATSSKPTPKVASVRD